MKSCEIKKSIAKGCVRATSAVKNIMPILFLTYMGTVNAFASSTHAADAIDGVLSIVYLITNILGILFVIVGFVKLVIAHSQEDAPGQQKAAMFIATGVALIAVKPVLGAIGFSSWIDTGN